MGEEKKKKNMKKKERKRKEKEIKKNTYMWKCWTTEEQEKHTKQNMIRMKEQNVLQWSNYEEEKLVEKQVQDKRFRLIQNLEEKY